MEIYFFSTYLVIFTLLKSYKVIKKVTNIFNGQIAPPKLPNQLWPQYEIAMFLDRVVVLLYFY